MKGYFSRNKASKILGIAYGTLIKYENSGVIKPHTNPMNGWPLYTDKILNEFLKKLNGDNDVE